MSSVISISGSQEEESKPPTGPYAPQVTIAVGEQHQADASMTMSC
jgi:hypothetical protein